MTPILHLENAHFHYLIGWEVGLLGGDEMLKPSWQNKHSDVHRDFQSILLFIQFYILKKTDIISTQRAPFDENISTYNMHSIWN